MNVTSMSVVGGRRQCVCTCGWRSPLLATRAEAAHMMLQHSGNSPCRALIGESAQIADRSIA